MAQAVTTTMEAEVLFDISTASYPWWFCWPFLLIALTAVGGFATVGYALSDSLPSDARWFLQNLCFYAGCLAAGLVLAAVGLFMALDLIVQRKMRLQRQQATLTVVEGDFAVGRVPRRLAGDGGGGGPVEPYTFKIIESNKKACEFNWQLARGHSMTTLAPPHRPGYQLRVSFVPNPKRQVQCALLIERIPKPAPANARRL